VHPWADTEAFNRLRERAQAVRPMMQAEHRALIDAALAEVEQRIGVCRLPACLAHGDFAPWNVRVQAGRLFAFDWEYAQAGANPLHDYLHFHLMSRLARHRPLGTRFMAPLLSRAGRHADSVFGVRSGVAEAAGALALHYLLDVITFYVEASRCLDPAHPVLRAYLQLLQQRGQWLGARTPVEGRT
jgi:aminoglycoside phosphotransferase (APT) family kinase protein